MHSIATPTVTGVILAGGRGSRMDNADKGLVQLAGRPLIEYALESLQPQVDTIIISANRNADTYAAYGRPVVADEWADFRGPLAGILAALNRCDTEYILTLPVDAPNPAPHYAARMLRALHDVGAHACVAHDGQRVQPMYALLHRNLRDALQAFLAAGQRKTQLWLETIDAVTVDFSGRDAQFANINTAAEKAHMESQWQVKL